MTPPAEQFTIETRTQLLGPARELRLRGVPGGICLLADGLVVLAMALLVHLSMGRVTPTAAAFLFVLFASGVHLGPAKRSLNIGALDDLGWLTRRVVAAYAAATAAGTVFATSQPRFLLALSAASLGLLFAARMAGHAIERAEARRGVLSPTLIVGTGETARLLIAAAKEDPHYGLDVVGAVGSATPFDRAKFGTRVVGAPEDIAGIVAARRIETIIVAFDEVSDRETLNQLREAVCSGADVWVVPRFFELGTEVSATQHMGGIPLVRVRCKAQERELWPMKRALDLVVSGLGALFASPLLGLIALAVKLDSKGPVFFSQERVGLDGRTFNMLKFRTMAPTSELHSKTEWGADANRVTRVGHLLRQTGLDELPQLFNVLKGDLTLVGPRPERPNFVKIFDEMYAHYSDRHRVPAGITGWAQIHGLRGDTSIEDRARFDNHYIENWSLAGDLKIILLTVRTLLKRYRGLTLSNSTAGTGTSDANRSTTNETTAEQEDRNLRRAG